MCINKHILYIKELIKMAEIRFQKLNQTDGEAAVDTLSGSGLAFFGATGGSSVAINAWQQGSWVSNGDGSTYTEQMPNNQYVTDGEFPSGRVTLGGAFQGTDTTLGLTGIKNMHGTLGIEFGHTTAVNIQNCQLRIYDRGNVNYPATGVNTRVAELINFNGATYATQGTSSNTSDAVGSGDIFWWGEPWPNAETNGTNFFTNSVGSTFYNGTTSDTNTNGDSRLSAAAVAGSYDTVGGTGIIVPLADSPGSGGKQLQNSEAISGTGQIWPKWTQYAQNSSFQTAVAGGNFGDGSSNKQFTYGGTGVDTHHTWSVALSASPLSSGGKEQYGLYVSLEYY